MNDTLESRFDKTLFRLTGGAEDPRFLVAFSGGADSTALLLLTVRFCAVHGGQVCAMHIHHGLRGDEADRDERFCRETCEKLGIGFFSAHVDVRALSREQNKSVEEAARILRYEALEKQAAELGAYILTAHHADDLLETMLFHIARGCGAVGMAGMPEKRGVILRPLLYELRGELTGYLARACQDYVTDSTNAEEICARNKLRLTVLPALKEICQGAPENAAALAQDLCEDEEVLCSLLPDKTPDREELRLLPPSLRKRYIARAYKAYCRETIGTEPMPERVHLQAASELCAQDVNGKSLSLPGGVKLTVDRAGLHFSPDKTSAEDYELPLREGENPLPGGEISIYLMKKKRFSEFWAKNEKIHSLFTKVGINSATMNGELTVRQRRAGDCVRTGGMTHSVRKLVSSVCADTLRRKNYPVVCDGTGVLWVPGCAPRDGCAADRDGQDENTIFILMGVTGYGIS